MNKSSRSGNQPNNTSKHPHHASKLASAESEFSQLYERAKRVGKRRSSRLLYKFLSMVVRTVGYRYLSFTCHGAEHLNLPGPLIIAPVHRSNLDVPLLVPASKRHIRSLAKDSMFKGRLSAWFSAAIGAIPVRRGVADRKSLQTIEQLLLDGEAVLVFPEGTRQSGTQVKEIFDGCAYLSAKCSAPVVPVGIVGTEDAMPPGVKLPKRVKVVACVGEPLSASAFSANPDTQKTRLSMSQRRAFSQELQKRLQALMSQASELRHKGKQQ